MARLAAASRRGGTGAGVIGSVYGGKLLQSGREVVMPALVAVGRAPRPRADPRGRGTRAADRAAGRRSRVCGPAGMPRFLQVSGSVSVDARVVRHPLLAKANGRPSGRAPVRRTWPSRVRRDVLPGGPVAAHDEHHRSSCARPRHLACRQSSAGGIYRSWGT